MVLVSLFLLPASSGASFLSVIWGKEKEQNLPQPSDRECQSCCARKAMALSFMVSRQSKKGPGCSCNCAGTQAAPSAIVVATPPPTIPMPPPTPAPVLPTPAAPPPLNPLRKLPKLGAEMLPTLPPGPTAGPLPPPPPPPPPAPTTPPFEYHVGNVYAGKDVNGTWQIVKLTREVDDPEHPLADEAPVFEGDVFGNVTLDGRLPVAEAHWPRVYADPEFLRATPAPPTTAVPTQPRLFAAGNASGEMLWTAQNATGSPAGAPGAAPAPAGAVAPPPAVFVLPANTSGLSGGSWPLAWESVPWLR